MPLHGYIHFIYLLIQIQNAEIYTTNQPKIHTEILIFCSFCPAVLGRKKRAFVIFARCALLVASGEKPKRLFPLTFPNECNLSFDNI